MVSRTKGPAAPARRSQRKAIANRGGKELLICESAKAAERCLPREGSRWAPELQGTCIEARLVGGAFSTARSTAPPHSPPSHSLPECCRGQASRSRDSIVSYPGNAPITKVERPMVERGAQAFACGRCDHRSGQRLRSRWGARPKLRAMPALTSEGRKRDAKHQDRSRRRCKVKTQLVYQAGEEDLTGSVESSGDPSFSSAIGIADERNRRDRTMACAPDVYSARNASLGLTETARAAGMLTANVRPRQERRLKSHERISRADLEKQSVDEARESIPTVRPTASNRCKCACLTQDEFENVGAICSNSDSHANFPGALGNGIRQYSIDADGSTTMRRSQRCRAGRGHSQAGH